MHSYTPGMPRAKRYQTKRSTGVDILAQRGQAANSMSRAQTKMQELQESIRVKAGQPSGKEHSGSVSSGEPLAPLVPGG